MSCGMCWNQSYSNINIDETIPHLTNLLFWGDLKNMSKRKVYQFNINKYNIVFFACVCVLVLIKIQQIEMDCVLSPTSELFFWLLGPRNFSSTSPSHRRFWDIRHNSLPVEWLWCRNCSPNNRSHTPARCPGAIEAFGSWKLRRTRLMKFWLDPYIHFCLGGLTVKFILQHLYSSTMLKICQLLSVSWALLRSQ